MASVLVYHVVGDLTVGKPELVEFHETETVESAIRAIAESPEGSIPIWKKRSQGVIENSDMRQNRFVGILSSFDIVAFLAKSWCLEDQDKAMKTPVSEVVVPNNSLLRLVDPGTRLIDALDMMKHGVKRLLVPKSIVWKGMSKRFSVVYYGKWLKNPESPSSSSNNLHANVNRNTSASIRDKYCCLSREDVLRFIIGCLGALAPIPLTSIAALGAINPHYSYIESSTPALESTQKVPQDPSAVAVIETTSDGQCKIIGEISAIKLWKCDYSSAAWALANLSAGQFVMGVEDNDTSRSLPDFCVNSRSGGDNDLVNNGGGSRKPKKFSSRSIGFFNNSASHSFGSRSMYRGRSAPLTCKVTSSLAAVMAQMLSHRATHVWVTEDENEEVLVGVVGYADILGAVTKPPTIFTPPIRSSEGFGNEIQC
ncbi:CBS domain-containing protein cbsx6 [Trifolium repens]|jgi:CBS domain-containing protein|nr:CBS domain-containing protein CBSX5 [Trifolium repens]WJX82862.1 CBS domain-containing protein cbsx6 [Trifolium repens]